MSIWTEMVGCITFEIPHFFGNAEESYRKMREDIVTNLGEIIYYEDIKKCTNVDNPIPCGKEGSLQYGFINDLVLAIWGNLRQYDESDVHKIDKWFRNIIEGGEDKYIIRDAVLKFKVAGGKSRILSLYFDKTNSPKVFIESLSGDENEDMD